MKSIAIVVLASAALAYMLAIADLSKRAADPGEAETFIASALGTLLFPTVLGVVGLFLIFRSGKRRQPWDNRVPPPQG